MINFHLHQIFIHLQKENDARKIIIRHLKEMEKRRGVECLEWEWVLVWEWV